MPRVFRQQYTRPIPADAEHVTIRNKKGEPAAAVRFKGSDGKKITAPVTTKGKSAGELCRVTSPIWYGRVNGERVPLCENKAAAEQMLGQLVRKAELGKAGITDPYEAHRKRPLADHLADFAAALRAKGDTAKHVQLTLSRLRAALDGMEAVFLADLDAGKAGEWLTTLRANLQPVELPEGQELFRLAEAAALLGVKPSAVSKAVQRNQLPATGKGKKRRFPRATVQDLADRAARGASAETVNHHARALRAFGRWLAGKRWPSNPFDSLALLNVATDRRHDRRELAADEMQRLLAVTGASTWAFRGLTGPDRAALYLTACSTGFRVRALAGLTPADFDLTADLPAIQLPARLAKNKKAKVQPLAPDVAVALRVYLDGRPQGVPVWPGAWNEDAAEMLRADLKAAGIPYAVEGPDGPLYADFHALRHTYLTLGGRAGIDLRTLQELAGHSNPNLTARYSHRRLHDLAGAVEKLPSILPTEEGTSEALRATGTEAAALRPDRAKACQAGHTQGEALQDKADPQSKNATLPYTPLTRAADSGGDRLRLAEITEGGTVSNANRPQPPNSEGVEAGCDQMRATENVSRLGLEPRTYGLTYRTGFHPPAEAVAVWTLPSPSA
jgi:excisionase family DNA binding protein